MLIGPSPNELSETECRHLLNSGGIGRLAVTFGALPRIVPVRFAPAGDSYLVCLGDQRNLLDTVDNTVVALAVDSLGESSPHGWLVEINGIARIAPQGPLPSCDQVQPVTATIEPTLITGSTFRLCSNTIKDPA